MVDCPIAIFVEIMSHVQLKDDALSHPFALDVLVAQTCASSWKKVVDELRDDLLEWVQISYDLPAARLSR